MAREGFPCEILKSLRNLCFTLPVHKAQTQMQSHRLRAVAASSLSWILEAQQQEPGGREGKDENSPQSYV